MKKIIFLLLACGICHAIFGQLTSIGFISEVKEDNSNRDRGYHPFLRLMGDTLYVCTPSGIYVKDLRKQADFEAYAFRGRKIIEFVKNGNRLIAVSLGSEAKTGIEDSVLLFSEDNGKTFIDYTAPDFKGYLWKISQNPLNKNEIFAGTFGQILKSSDFGKNWELLATPNCFPIWFMSFHPADISTFYFSGETYIFQGVIWKSKDRQKTWSRYRHPGGDNSIHCIAFHPRNPDILVYSGEGAMGKSTDRGETWKSIDLYKSRMYFYKVLFDEEQPHILYASGTRGHSHINNNNTLYVYCSTDTGDSWHCVYKEPLKEDCGGVLDMVKYKDKLIFYTRKSGLFALDTKDTKDIPLSNEKIPEMLEISVYPNPVRSILYFRSQIPVLQINVLDMSGQTLIEQKNSEHTGRVDVSHLPSGTYPVIFHTDNGVVTKKIIVH